MGWIVALVVLVVIGGLLQDHPRLDHVAGIAVRILVGVVVLAMLVLFVYKTIATRGDSVSLPTQGDPPSPSGPPGPGSSVPPGGLNAPTGPSLPN
jgi:hypothetical protein